MKARSFRSATQMTTSLTTPYRDSLKVLYMAARIFFLFLLNCSAWPCLGPAQQNISSSLLYFDEFTFPRTSGSTSDYGDIDAENASISPTKVAQVIKHHIRKETCWPRSRLRSLTSVTSTNGRTKGPSVSDRSATIYLVTRHIQHVSFIHPYTPIRSSARPR